VRRRLPPAPPELPARLRCFDPAEWDVERDTSADAVQQARDRWNDARMTWAHDHGVSPLDVIRQGINDRRRAAGVPPIDYHN